MSAEQLIAELLRVRVEMPPSPVTDGACGCPTVSDTLARKVAQVD